MAVQNENKENSFMGTITIATVADGAEGKPGASAGSYSIECSPAVLLKGYSADTKPILVPDQGAITFSVYKENILVTQSISVKAFIVSVPTEGIRIEIEEKVEQVEKEIHVIKDELTNIFTLDFSNPQQFYLTTESSDLIKIEAELADGTFLTHFIEYRLQMTEDLAQFNVTAQNINAAVGASKLVFSSTGLQIENGSFKIVESDNTGKTTDLFYTDKGNLILKGHIMASGGKIGGFTIGETQLTSSENESENKDENSSPSKTGSSIILDGAKGTIYSEHINLGKEAYITEQIILPEYAECIEGIEYAEYYQKNDIGGYDLVLDPTNKNTETTYYYRTGNTAYIKNPASNEKNIFLHTTNRDSNDNLIDTFSLDSKGHMKIGDFEFDGKESNISLPGHWEIEKNGQATFEKIIASEAVIGNSILEVNKIQTAGGIMIFKDGSKVKDIIYNASYEDGDVSFTKVLLRDKLNFAEGDRVLLSCNEEKRYCTVVHIGNSEQGNNKGLYDTVYITEDLTDFDASKSHLTHIFHKSENNKDNFIFAINSNDSVTLGKNSLNVSSNPLGFIRGRALALSEAIVNDKNEESFVTRLLLGDLSSVDVPTNDILGHKRLDGMGLYADNVYLTGSLVTNRDGVYAGVNTSGSFGPQKDPIIFWGGSKGPDSIDDAPFKVTANGYLYASKGEFSGVIKSAEIQTSRIYGNPNDYEPALQIYDSRDALHTQSIGFYNTIIPSDVNAKIEKEKHEQTFYINSKGFHRINKMEPDNDNAFIQLDTANANVYFSGQKFAIKKENEEFLVFDQEGLWKKTFDKNNPKGIGMYFEDQTEISLKLNSSSDKKFTLNNEGIFLNHNYTCISKELILNDSSRNIKGEADFRLVDGGYDLYITE